MSDDDLILKVAVLKTISAFTTEKYNEAREEAAAVLERGDRRMARSPLDKTKIGAVTMTDPKPTARVSDLDILTAWLEENYPDSFVSGYDVIGTEEQVRAVLFEHAPEMLGKVRRINPLVIKELLSEAVTIGQAVGPGGEVDMPGISVTTPDGVVSCKPDPATALDTVLHLIRSERVSLDGTVRHELPTGEPA